MLHAGVHLTAQDYMLIPARQRIYLILLNEAERKHNPFGG